MIPCDVFSFAISLKYCYFHYIFTLPVEETWVKNTSTNAPLKSIRKASAVIFDQISTSLSDSTIAFSSTGRGKRQSQARAKTLQSPRSIVFYDVLKRFFKKGIWAFRHPKRVSAVPVDEKGSIHPAQPGQSRTPKKVGIKCWAPPWVYYLLTYFARRLQ